MPLALAEPISKKKFPRVLQEEIHKLGNFFSKVGPANNVKGISKNGPHLLRVCRHTSAPPTWMHPKFPLARKMEIPLHRNIFQIKKY